MEDKDKIIKEANKIIQGVNQIAQKYQKTGLNIAIEKKLENVAALMIYVRKKNKTLTKEVLADALRIETSESIQILLKDELIKQEAIDKATNLARQSNKPVLEFLVEKGDVQTFKSVIEQQIIDGSLKAGDLSKVKKMTNNQEFIQVMEQANIDLATKEAYKIEKILKKQHSQVSVPVTNSTHKKQIMGRY